MSSATRPKSTKLWPADLKKDIFEFFQEQIKQRKPVSAQDIRYLPKSILERTAAFQGLDLNNSLLYKKIADCIRGKIRWG